MSKTCCMGGLMPSRFLDITDASAPAGVHNYRISELPRVLTPNMRLHAYLNGGS